MKQTIEQAMEQYFPVEWSAHDVKKFIKQARFELDIIAANKSLNQPIRDFIFRGGKRMRPQLFLTLLKGFGKDPRQYLDLAVLIELVHNGTLVIDDIEDRSELRRGQPTLHKKFDIDIAINAGVAMHFLLLRELAEENPTITNKQRLKLYEIYSDETINVHFGQALDIYWHKNIPEGITVEKYLEMSRLKTGSLTRMAVRFASALAEQGEKVEQALITFAESAGIAYQIKDDVLDITADKDAFGKSFGNDITEGKMSLPVIFAIKELSPADKKQLVKILKMHTHDKQLLKKAQNLVTSTSAISKSLTLAEKTLTASWKQIEPKLPPGECRTALQSLVTSFITREY